MTLVRVATQDTTDAQAPHTSLASGCDSLRRPDRRAEQTARCPDVSERSRKKRCGTRPAPTLTRTVLPRRLPRSLSARLTTARRQGFLREPHPQWLAPVGHVGVVAELQPRLSRRMTRGRPRPRSPAGATRFENPVVAPNKLHGARTS